MPQEHILDRSILEIAGALRDGSVKSQEILDEAVARHDKYDAALMAYKYWDGEGARAEARAIDALIDAGHDTGAMMGLPFSAKDIFGIKGMPTCGGTPAELPEKWQEEGPVVKSLRSGLAIATGKTHSVEFAFGGVGPGAHWDTPRNPWDAEEHRVTGGSSSGAGVSVCQGSALIALGTDTGGSVRIPASVTGNVGLKTTIGRWSTEGIVPLSSSFDTPGLMSRSVEDAVVAYALIDPDEDNPEDLLAQAGGLEAGSLRLGICDEHFWNDCSPGIAEGVKGALDELVSKGARLNRISLPHFTEARERFVKASLFGVEGRSFIDEHYPDRLKTLDSNIKARFDLAVEVSAVDYYTEQRQIDRLCNEVDYLLRHVDGKSVV